MESVPGLRLSLGQLARALNRGQPADARLRNEVRYLRQLGVPHAERAVGKGRGNPIYYSFEDLIEVGVALNAIRRGMKRQDAATVLIRERRDFRKLFRNAWLSQPTGAESADWVKSPDRIASNLSNELFLRLHDRYSSKPGTYEVIAPGKATTFSDTFGMREVFPDNDSRVLVPLTKLVLELVVWAREAPAVRAGRPG